MGWLEETVGIRRLADRTILEIGGDDARSWLQGQITNETEGVEPGGSVYGFILSLKGRVLVDVWALMREDDVWLDIPATEVETLVERLDRYIIMEDVDLVHRDDLALWTAQGPKNGALERDGWPSDRLGFGGRVFVTPVSEADAVWSDARTQAEALGGGEIEDEAWARAHVIHGRPRFGVDFSAETYPQETGLTAHAVSFNKGCYIGQETVVMLQNRGKAPKTLWRWRLDTASPPASGSPILHDGRAAGTLTSAVPDGDGTVALGFVKRGFDPEGGDGFLVEGARATPEHPVGQPAS